jgi:hypothetical protein
MFVLVLPLRRSSLLPPSPATGQNTLSSCRPRCDRSAAARSCRARWRSSYPPYAISGAMMLRRVWRVEPVDRGATTGNVAVPRIGDSASAMIMSDSPPPRCIEGRVVADMDRRVIVRRPSKLPSSPVVAEASRSKLVSVRDGDETPASHSCAGGGPRGVLPGAPRRIRADMARRGGVGVGAAGATRAVVPESK